jgi:hypothetical protein
MVGFELEVLSKKVDRFGWDRDRGTPSHDRQMLDWMDGLQDFQLDEVQAACNQAIIDRPNKCPNEGHIRNLIMRERGKIMASIPKQPPPIQAVEPVTMSAHDRAEYKATLENFIDRRKMR